MSIFRCQRANGVTQGLCINNRVILFMSCELRNDAKTLRYGRHGGLKSALVPLLEMAGGSFDAITTPSTFNVQRSTPATIYTSYSQHIVAMSSENSHNESSIPNSKDLSTTPTSVTTEALDESQIKVSPLLTLLTQTH